MYLLVADLDRLLLDDEPFVFPVELADQRHARDIRHGRDGEVVHDSVRDRAPHDPAAAAAAGASAAAVTGAVVRDRAVLSNGGQLMMGRTVPRRCRRGGAVVYEQGRSSKGMLVLSSAPCTAALCTYAGSRLSALA